MNNDPSRSSRTNLPISNLVLPDTRTTPKVYVPRVTDGMNTTLAALVRGKEEEEYKSIYIDAHQAASNALGAQRVSSTPERSA